MEEKILQAILEEIKGLRKDTNNRFESLENRVGKVEEGVGGLRDDTNKRFVSLEGRVVELKDDTNKRFVSLEKKVDGLNETMQVVQLGFNLTRQELTKISEILGEKVIWNNETITFGLNDGSKQYGTIH